MSLGIVLRGMNNIYFKDYLSFFTEFIPQLLILLSLFGYMNLLIIVKWLTPYTDYPGQPNPKDIYFAPSIITTMIQIFLGGGAPPEVVHADTKEIVSEQLIPGQQAISLILLAVFILNIPILLLAKPCVLKRRLGHHAPERHQSRDY